MTMNDGLRHPFIIIAENIHATRVVLRSGPRVTALPDGRPALPFVDDWGADLLLPVADAALDGPEGPRQRVKHVKAAVLAGLGGDRAAADLGRGYVRAMARRQAEAGADFLDINVDEVTTDPAGRVEAMRWVVEAVEDATDARLAFDSSSSEVLRAGVAACSRRAGPPLLNSAALDRLDVLGLAHEAGCPVVLSASGVGRMPASAEDRVVNARALVEAAMARDIGPGDLFVDALVLPVAVNPEVGGHFLDAVRTLRAEYGPQLHLTGGLSNVSFGLPARKLINDVFIDLAVTAGADSGIVDPVANDPRRIFAQDREARPYRLAADLLTGADAYGGEFLMAFRGGELG
jgi:5-methyltetrahydrofolate--homocysteine methyltransferase